MKVTHFLVTEEGGILNQREVLCENACTLILTLKFQCENDSSGF